MSELQRAVRADRIVRISGRAIQAVVASWEARRDSCSAAPETTDLQKSRARFDRQAFLAVVVPALFRPARNRWSPAGCCILACPGCSSRSRCGWRQDWPKGTRHLSFTPLPWTESTISPTVWRGTDDGGTGRDPSHTTGGSRHTHSGVSARMTSRYTICRCRKPYSPCLLLCRPRSISRRSDGIAAPSHASSPA